MFLRLPVHVVLQSLEHWKIRRLLLRWELKAKLVWWDFHFLYLGRRLSLTIKTWLYSFNFFFVYTGIASTGKWTDKVWLLGTYAIAMHYRWSPSESRLLHGASKIKHLDDIPMYWERMIALKLSKFQYIDNMIISCNRIFQKKGKHRGSLPRPTFSIAT